MGWGRGGGFRRREQAQEGTAKLGRSKMSKWILPGAREPTGLKWWAEGYEGL